MCSHFVIRVRMEEKNELIKKIHGVSKDIAPILSVTEFFADLSKWVDDVVKIAGGRLVRLEQDLGGWHKLREVYADKRANN